MTNPSHTLTVERLRPNAQLPAYATEGAAGLDLACAFEDAQPRTLLPGEIAKVPTGLRIALPAGHEGQVRPRSGLAAKHGVTVLNAPGTIDEDYRGELMVLLVHHGREPLVLEDGMRIAQLVVAPVTRARVLLGTVVTHDTARGEGGFGSTGTASRPDRP
ncbi:MAG: dUTP diphosphatase [Sandaracinaceae bacterium]|jgi:dUTP pyrophosphatase|nr:dUTP diphosphatase [Sandaracinaceae bacterium]MBP7680401.1 dUTP diphosphatase [Deltaproteobacteria bacterium]MBK6811316.1 dUTP diphosphatase [Sandaracinaceae bacterium]MBK7776616.1 dUTP diphosphatase [Sandaracinaceae bacterium]MBK8407437.1 dUTP diphosphatase [Sandaracinaceae bacterium]